MRITASAKAVLARAGLHADWSITELAKRTRTRPHTVRYILSHLIELQIVRKRWVIDLMACGWKRYEIFFAVAPGTRGARTKMVDWLIKQELCTYLAEVGGEFDYEMIFVAKSSRQVGELLSELNKRCGEVCFSKAVAQHTKVCYFARKYLSSAQLPLESLALQEVDGAPHELDQIDHSLLRLLAEEPDISQREMARRCHCTPLTVARRIEQLRNRGVIRGAMYSFSGAILGAQNYIFLIYARGLSPTLANGLYQFCVKHPFCTNMKECFGSWDFEVGVEVPDHSRLRAIREDILENFSGDIVRITVLSRFSTLKYDLYPLREAW
jgi:DNA-binding Lrp family transcriptional regulator